MMGFRVEFFKEVTGDTGQDVIASQGAFNVSAADPESAAKVAQRLFCEARGIRHWSVNADNYLVQRTMLAGNAADVIAVAG
jgi:hypothetical protein